MPATDASLSETDIRPADGEELAVRADDRDGRKWLSGAPVCPALNDFRIRHAGVARMPWPFSIVRARLGGSYFLACFDGEGRVLVDGAWEVCRPGNAVLLPPGTLHAFQTVEGRSWSFCWVRYEEGPGQVPLAASMTPVVASFDAEPLRLAILGMRRESEGEALPGALEGWARLVQHYVTRFAQPAGMDRRLWKLWERVGNHLEQPWTVAEMAAEAHLSEKQFQRLCRRELGRNPRRQLIWLRMREAAALLADDALKVETIAARVGYQNPFVFSTTFKRVMGWSPSSYPGRKAAGR